MQKQAKKILVLTLGIIFIMFGILGLVLPFLQGIIFLAIGFFLLSIYYPRSFEWMEKYTAKYPRLHSKIKKLEIWAKKFIGEI